MTSICKLLSTVHDSVVLDVKPEGVDKVAKMLYSVWEDIPEEFERLFGVELDLPCKVEVSVGPNLKTMEVIPNG